MSDNATDELARAIECLLFASPETLPEARLAEILDVGQEALEQGLHRLEQLLADRGLQVVQLAGGYQLATRPDYASVVHRLLQPAPARLSTQALEVLAIVAYRQPMTRPEIDDIRGVNSQHAVATLVEKGMVTTVGRKSAPGRPLLYGTTPHFLSTFGLKDIRELPNLAALREAIPEDGPSVLRGVSQTGDDSAFDHEAEDTEAPGEEQPPAESVAVLEEPADYDAEAMPGEPSLTRSDES